MYTCYTNLPWRYIALTSWYLSQLAVALARFFSSSTAFCRTVCNLLVSSVFSPEIKQMKEAFSRGSDDKKNCSKVQERKAIGRLCQVKCKISRTAKKTLKSP